MKKLFILFLAFISIMAVGTGNKKDFTVTLLPPKDMPVKKFYLDRVIDDKLVRDSADAIDGVVKFNGTTEYPLKCRIMLLKPDRYVEFVDVLLEGADIRIDASKGLQEVKYSGSPVQDQFSQWKATEGPIIKKLLGKWEEVSKANEKDDKEALKKANNDIAQLRDELNAAKEKFLLSSSKSLVAGLMLKDYVTPVWEHLDVAERVYNELPQDIRSLPDLQKFGKELAVAIQISKGKNFPDIALPDSTGKMVSSAAYKGKVVLVDFWASWCGPCRAESPALREAYTKYKDKGFDILSISFDQNTKAWLKAVAKDGYTWANVVDSTGMGPKGKISAQYNIMAIPRNFLLDKDGKIIATNLRGEGLEKKLKELFGS